MFTEDEVRDMIRQRIAEIGGQNRYARHVGVSSPFMVAVMSGATQPSFRICQDLGLRLVKRWEKNRLR